MTFIGLVWVTIAAGLLVGVRRRAFAVHVADTVGISAVATILLVAGALALGVGAQDDVREAQTPTAVEDVSPTPILRQDRTGTETSPITVGPADEQHDDRGRIDSVLTPHGSPVMATPDRSAA